MSNIVCQSSHRTCLTDKCRPRRGLFLWISFLLLLGFAIRSTVQAADLKNRAATSIGPGSRFAIADFDGDLRPDLARVEAGANTSGGANYWIQLQLTSIGRQTIQLVGPAGGLVIEARDVNGDRAIDLVLATAWFRQPVAIFLNDGHGGFSRAEPNAFPAAFKVSKTHWLSTANLATDAVGLPPQSGADARAEENNALDDRSAAGWIPPSRAGFPLGPFLISQPGRAPPSEVSYL